MKLSHPLLAALAGTVLFTGTAGAQLKPPREGSAAAPLAPAANASRDGATAAKEAAGQLAAGGWLLLLDRRDWGRAWETSSSVFRGAVPLATWMDGIPKLREPLGAFLERTPSESVYKTTLEGRPDGEYVTVIFVSKFEQRELEEVVTTLRDPDGKWRVTGYLTR
jgi:hypothetical protein